MTHEKTRKEIKETMAFLMVDWGADGIPVYPRIVEEYERLLKIMGNVDDNEVIALVLLAACNVDSLDGSFSIRQ